MSLKTFPTLLLTKLEQEAENRSGNSKESIHSTETYVAELAECHWASLLSVACAYQLLYDSIHLVQKLLKYYLSNNFTKQLSSKQ